MPADPFTIRIFMPDGDPESVRIIDRMNWTGKGISFPRSAWPEIRNRQEFATPGIYILVGYQDNEDDLPTTYIGQGDAIKNRIESHYQNKDFWDTAVIFVSTSGGLNRAHITWLEYALIARADDAKRCHLDNGNKPQEPALTESEKADTQAFLKEVMQILPIVGIRLFETAKAVATPGNLGSEISVVSKGTTGRDTIVVPAQKEGFEEVFLGEDCWYAIRISGGMLHKIKYIAAYQSQPISAITHAAPVDRIEPYGDGGKYKVVFSEKAKPIGPIPFGDAPLGSMQGPRYTSYERLKSVRSVTDLFE